MAQNFRLPAQQVSPNFSSPIPDEAISVENQKPHFSFEYLNSDYCISRCDKKEKVQFIDRIRVLGSQTWGEIKSNAANNGGYELILTDQIRGSKPKIITPEVNKIMVFHFGDHIPLAGHKSKNVFYIIWIDREFKLYDHG